METIITGFRPELHANKQLRFSTDTSDVGKEKRWNFTEEQRKLASEAIIPKDFADFEKKVCFSYFLKQVS